MSTETSASEADGRDVVVATESITKEFGGLVAVDDVDLQIRTGEIVGLIGPNGAGKTTLFNCIAGVYTPTRGRILLNGDDVTGVSPHLIARKGLARTFQISRPLEEMTVLDNVMVGAHIHTRRSDEASERARRQLEFVGLGEMADREASELTIASQKRMELARTLAIEPNVLLIDELMAGLTPTETEKMLDLFRRISEDGVSLFVIEHDMESVMAISDRVAVLNEGRKIADSDPEEVANDPRVVDAYLGDHDA